MGLLDKVKETASQAKDAATKFADEKGISGGSGSIIEKLSKLKDSRILSEEEFATKKTELLAKL